MFVTRKALSRRTILKGLGTAVALPFLDAMSPAMAAVSPAPMRSEAASSARTAASAT